MRKLAVITSMVLGLFVFTGVAYADSPITSTDFSKAYEDIAIVAEAQKMGIINEEMAEYLSDESNPFDVKAAIINGLSWSSAGKDNAQRYSEMTYKTPIENLDMENLSGDQLFCIGYLLAMDDYFDTELSLEYLKLAETKIRDSLTVSLIRGLVDSMDTAENEWDNHIQPILVNEELNRDLRQDALNIILDYMALYTDGQELIVSRNDITIEIGKSERVYLYGTYSSRWEVPYWILSDSNWTVKDSDIADTKLDVDQYGVYYLEITGLKEGEAFVEVESIDEKKVSINFRVISGDAAANAPKTGVLSLGFFFGAGMLLTAAGAAKCKRTPDSGID